MAYTLPTYEIPELSMRLDALGRPEFCQANEEAFVVTFHIGIEADADGEWEITDIYMGTQRLRRGTELYGRCFQQIEAEHAGDIHEFVSENYAAAVEGAHLDYDKTRPRTLKHDLKPQIEGVA